MQFSSVYLVFFSFITSCGPFLGREQNHSGAVEEEGSTGEFSYLEQQRFRTDRKQSKDKEAATSEMIQTKRTMANSLEVCAELPLQRCISCCEDFFTAGSANWDRCVAVCGERTAELPQEY